jgi:hypothetical protein
LLAPPVQGLVEPTLPARRQFAGHGVAVWPLRESWAETSDTNVGELITAIMEWLGGWNPGAADTKPPISSTWPNNGTTV